MFIMLFFQAGPRSASPRVRELSSLAGVVDSLTLTTERRKARILMFLKTAGPGVLERVFEVEVMPASGPVDAALH